MSTGLFDAMVAAVAPMLGRSVAPFTLSRLLIRARLFERDALTVAQLRAAMPTIEAGLAELLTPAELREAQRALSTVVDATTPPDAPSAQQTASADGTPAPRRRRVDGALSARAAWAWSLAPGW